MMHTVSKLGFRSSIAAIGRRGEQRIARQAINFIDQNLSPVDANGQTQFVCLRGHPLFVQTGQGEVVAEIRTNC